MRGVLFVLLLCLISPALAQGAPETVEALVSRGSESFDAGDTEAARADAEQALSQSPEDFAAIVLMGRVLGRTEHWEEAMPYFERALAQRPDDAVALRGKALTLSGLGRSAEAMALIDHALALYPKDATLWFNRAWVTYRSKEQPTDVEIESALADLGRAQELDPTDPDPWGTSGWLKYRYQGQSVPALRDLRHALELGPKADDYYTRALIYLGLQQRGRAESDVRDGLRIVGRDTELRESLQELLDEIKASGE